MVVCLLCRSSQSDWRAKWETPTLGARQQNRHQLSKLASSHPLAGNSGTCKEEGFTKSANEKYKEGGGGVTRDPWGEETHL